MGLVLTEFANEILFEILGHLSGLDILSSRQVCQKLHEASKERSVWVNAVQRARCLLPPIPIPSTPTHDLERTLLRMEIMDAQWAGSRAITAHVCAWTPFSKTQGHAFCFMPPYVVFRHMVRIWYYILTWYHVDDTTGEPVYQYYVELAVPGNIDFDHENRTLNIVTNVNDASELNITSFQILGKDHAITQTRNCNLTRPDILPERSRAKVRGDYLIYYATCPPFTGVRVLIHLAMKKAVICSLNATEDPQPPHFDLRYLLDESHRITPTHFIYANNLGVAAYKLPTQAQLKSKTQTPIHLHAMHINMCPRILEDFGTIGPIFIHSPTTFVLFANGRSPEQRICLFWFLLDEHDTTCHLVDRLTLHNFAATGKYFHGSVRPCSMSPATTLGLITITHECSSDYGIWETRHFTLRLRLDPPPNDDTMKGNGASHIQLRELHLPLPVGLPAPEEGEFKPRFVYLDAYSGVAIADVRLSRRTRMPDGSSRPLTESDSGHALIRFTE